MLIYKVGYVGFNVESDLCADKRPSLFYILFGKEYNSLCLSVCKILFCTVTYNSCEISVWKKKVYFL